jgi:hypothetical protein
MMGNPADAGMGFDLAPIIAQADDIEHDRRRTLCARGRFLLSCGINPSSPT